MVLVLGASGDSPHSKASEPEVAGATPDTRRHTTPKAKRIVSMVDVWVASCVRLPHRQPPASVELDGSVSLYLLYLPFTFQSFASSAVRVRKLLRET